MTEPNISPLARRLAEENNVNWRSLQGSGAGGKVVERDVLEYLARVMSGDEDVDPTPEPVPEGMEAWPEEDVAGAWSSGSARSAQASAGGRGQAGGGLGDEIALPSEEDDVELISEDIFLFGDEDEEDGEDGDLLLSDDRSAGSGPDGAADLDDDPLFAEPEPSPGAEAAPSGFLSTDEGSGDEVGAAADVAPNGSAGERPAGPDAFDEMFFEDAPSYGERGEDAGADEVLDDDLFTPDDEVGLETADDEGDAGGDGLPDLFASNGAEASELPDLDDADDGTEAEAAAAEQDRSVPGDGHADEALEEAGPPKTTPEEADEPGRAGDHAPQPTPSETALAAVPAARHHAETNLPLVRRGNLLRRHVDLSALAVAQLGVAQELGREEPLPPTAFLLRAAARVLASEPLPQGAGVGLAVLEPRFGAAAVEDAAAISFRALVSAVEAATPGGSDDIALAVADLSALEVDEAVLDLEAPVLTLGRILYDNQRGSYRSTLSVSGDLPPEVGARLLARAAELLDAPVRLVL